MRRDLALPAPCPGRLLGRSARLRNSIRHQEWCRTSYRAGRHQRQRRNSRNIIRYNREHLEACPTQCEGELDTARPVLHLHIKPGFRGVREPGAPARWPAALYHQRRHSGRLGAMAAATPGDDLTRLGVAHRDNLVSTPDGAPDAGSPARLLGMPPEHPRLFWKPPPSRCARYTRVHLHHWRLRHFLGWRRLLPGAGWSGDQFYEGQRFCYFRILHFRKRQRDQLPSGLRRRRSKAILKPWCSPGFLTAKPGALPWDHGCHFLAVVD